MKKLIFILLFISFLVKGQDPSFSQFDLNMNYTNPAYTSYEGGTRFLLHSRNQWNRINGNFNNSIFEFSSRVKLNRNSKKLKSSWCFGLSVLSEDLFLFPEIGNSVFLNKVEISVMPFTLEMKISKNSYITAAPLNITFRQYNLNSDNLLFSDMIDDFGQEFTTSSFNPNLFIHNEWIGDGSFGAIFTHGKYQRNKTNRFNIGIASHHVLKRPIESFSGTNISDSKIPTKWTIHSEYFSSTIPAFKRPIIPYFRVMAKYESYFKEGESIISKTEMGATAFLNNTPIEFGTLFRIVRDNIHVQTWTPILRIRKSNSTHLYVFSYSYDANVAQQQNQLQFVNTGTTHELGLSIYLFAGKGKNKDCAAFGVMENNALYQDIMKAGLVNSRKPLKGKRKKIEYR